MTCKSNVLNDEQTVMGYSHCLWVTTYSGFTLCLFVAFRECFVHFMVSW